ncbi:di-heme oxidoredictase family protein [Microvirga flavescens]|uniref:di-heme oxidoredictase family protein n=1 Tax=Microvirga flavescens TaxID=2249811 RepID=UPI000DDA768D|nr:di-heme oxidoredictase family protein [Microvirga flavescens]
MKRFVIAGLIGIAPVQSHALDEAIGRALFRRAWVPAPSSTLANDGLGPLFNARSCAACHTTLDRVKVETDAAGIVMSDNIALRFSNASGAPDPVYGRQLQTSAVSGVMPEGRIVMSNGCYKPDALAYGDLDPQTRTGTLLAPALRGLGLIETIPDAAILAMTQEEKPDGVRGRINWVTDSHGQKRIGRFGWKASAPTLPEQVEQAFHLDLGMSTLGRPALAGDCTSAQKACLAAPHGGDETTPEISGEIVSRIAAYLASIAPPPVAETKRAGERLFAATGCAACHRPSIPGKDGPVRAFTDLLLHDMGAELDGGATEPGVASTEWRTAPLWGLSRALANSSRLLHDGRASTLEDAIRLHGGEAARARTRFEALNASERQKLIEYLRSL